MKLAYKKDLLHFAEQEYPMNVANVTTCNLLVLNDHIICTFNEVHKHLHN